jgi:predicted nucleic acid-binding protein
MPGRAQIKVVDASALAALFFGEPAAGVVAGQSGDARLVTPAFLGFELANVCMIKARRRPGQRMALAAAIGLTADDASYPWLTRQLDADLVTLDQQLAKADASYRG